MLTRDYSLISLQPGVVAERNFAILNGGQRRDRTADAGLFRAPYQWT
jgi:hypothetical protein